MNPFGPLAAESAEDKEKKNDEKARVEFVTSIFVSVTTIDELEEAVTKSCLDIQQFEKPWKNCKGEKVDAMIDEIYRFFAEHEDALFMAHLRERIMGFDTVDLKPMLDRTIKRLEERDLSGFATLFLIGTIVAQRPDLVTPKLLGESHEPIAKVAPFVCWIVSRAISSSSIEHLDPLLSHNLLEFFLPRMMSGDEADAVSLRAAPLIDDAFKGQKVYRVCSEHYVKLLKLAHKKKTGRDQQVAEVLRALVKKLVVTDMKDLARQMMQEFPDAPDFACRMFVAEATKENGTNVSFVDGWVEAHGSHKKVSMMYLGKVLRDLPEAVVNKFPMRDLREGGDLATLAAMKVELTNASFRFTFLIFLLIVAWQIHKHYYFGK